MMRKQRFVIEGQILDAIAEYGAGIVVWLETRDA